jgi:hypothetical protein
MCDGDFYYLSTAQQLSMERGLLPLLLPLRSHRGRGRVAADSRAAQPRALQKRPRNLPQNGRAAIAGAAGAGVGLRSSSSRHRGWVCGGGVGGCGSACLRPFLAAGADGLFLFFVFWDLVGWFVLCVLGGGGDK